ncbi:MAG: superoxide dismutase [Cytophagales bacterium]
MNLFLKISLFLMSYVVFSQHKLPDLAYTYDALEPHFDKQTMLIHHSKHHQAYVDNLNKEATTYPEVANKTVEEICRTVNKFNMAVRNNAGGHYNHSLFWKLLSPKATKIGTKTNELINRDFGSIEDFKKEFSQVAKSRFGSGWAWLIVTQDKNLKVVSTPNQDNPLMPVVEIQGEPILALDVWEHAYYLKFQNKRADYVEAFWNVVNWDYVEHLLEKSLKK